MASKIFTKLVRHKFPAGIALVLIAGGGYYGYTSFMNNKDVIRYVLAEAQKGTLIISVSGSGQVSASNQVDTKPKASGEVVGIYVRQGQEVKTNTLLAQLDASDAVRAVRDALTSLETAKLELDKLLAPLDELTILQAENNLTLAKESKQKALDNLKKAYEDGFNTVADAFLDVPAVITGLYDILFSSGFTAGSASQLNIDYYANSVEKYDAKVLEYKKDASDKYRAARAAYDKNFENYKSASRFSPENVIESLIDESYDTMKAIAEAVKSTNNFIRFYQEKMTEHSLKPQALSDTHLSSLESYTATTNSYLSGLLSARRSIQDYKESITSTGRTIQERELSLADLKEGPDTLDIRAKKIAIQQKQDALASARQDLADRSVRAPFDGIIAKVSVKKGDTASSGTSVATLVTKQKIAEVSLNEVDAAKIKTGQKATLTFDAVPDLTLTGLVTEVDTLGTVSQGVVTYTVKIGFDTQDERIKTAMSVSASIVTEVKPDVLLAPNSAVKTQSETSYVEVPDSSDATVAASAALGDVALTIPPRRQEVEIGIANDEYTEILSGLKEGDLMVTRTLQPNSQRTQASSQQGLRIPGLPTGGGGGFRSGSGGAAAH